MRCPERNQGSQFVKELTQAARSASERIATSRERRRIHGSPAFARFGRGTAATHAAMLRFTKGCHRCGVRASAARAAAPLATSQRVAAWKARRREQPIARLLAPSLTRWTQDSCRATTSGLTRDSWTHSGLTHNSPSRSPRDEGRRATGVPACLFFSLRRAAKGEEQRACQRVCSRKRSDCGRGACGAALECAPTTLAQLGCSRGPWSRSYFPNTSASADGPEVRMRSRECAAFVVRTRVSACRETAFRRRASRAHRQETDAWKGRQRAMSIARHHTLSWDSLGLVWTHSVLSRSIPLDSLGTHLDSGLTRTTHLRGIATRQVTKSNVRANARLFFSRTKSGRSLRRIAMQMRREELCVSGSEQFGRDSRWPLSAIRDLDARGS